MIIDACVARSASPVGVEKIPGSLNRDFLLKIQELGYFASYGLILRKEYQHNKSLFFEAWLSQMVRDEKTNVIDDIPSSELLQQIQDSTNCNSDVEGMKKDAHLLAGAISSDSKVISSENVVRRNFSKNLKANSQVMSIIWVNPTKEDENVIQWLEDGAPDEASRRLGNYIP